MQNQKRRKEVYTVNIHEAITETMRETSIENAEKFLNALRGALSAILANLEGGGSDVG